VEIRLSAGIGSKRWNIDHLKPSQSVEVSAGGKEYDIL
jgi:hypothetical protein